MVIPPVIATWQCLQTKLLTRLSSLQLGLFDLCWVILFALVLISFLVNQMRGYFRLSPSQASHPPPSLPISLSPLPPPPPRPTAACPTAHQNDNGIDVKCVAFGPLKHITPACLAQLPPQFMALLCSLLCPPLLGRAGNNLENSLYMCPCVCWHVCVRTVRTCIRIN